MTGGYDPSKVTCWAKRIQWLNLEQGWDPNKLGPVHLVDGSRTACGINVPVPRGIQTELPWYVDWTQTCKPVSCQKCLQTVKYRKYKKLYLA